MIRQVSQDRLVDPYSLDIDELRAFSEKVSARFDGPYRVRITVMASNEEFKFDGVEEMYDCRDLPDYMHKFRMYFSSKDSDHSCFVFSSDEGCHRCGLSAQADSEGWCADVIETAASLLQRHRTWYFFLFRPSFFIILGTLFLPVVYVIARSLGIASDSPIDLVGTLVLALLLEGNLFFLFLMFSGLSPPTATIRREGHRKHGYKWIQVGTLIVGAITALAAVVAAISGLLSLLKSSP